MRFPWLFWVTLVVAGPLGPISFAHDLHIMGSKLKGKVGDETTVYVTRSHAEPVDEIVEADSLEHYLLVGPSGTRAPLNKKNAGLQANKIKLDSEGVHQALAIGKQRVVTKLRGEDGKHLHVDGPKTDAAHKRPGAKIVSATKSQEYSKVIVVVGSRVPSPKPTGLPFEIVPLDEPSQWKAGKSLRFQVLYNDMPLPSARLAASPIAYALPGRDEESWITSAKTDAKGIAELTPTQPGRWLIQVEHSFKPDTANQRLFDREDYVTSVIIELDP
jgi:uncharacterized GH25 family protein